MLRLSNLRSLAVLLLMGVISPVYAQKESKKGKDQDPAAVEPAADQIRVCKLDVFYDWSPDQSIDSQESGKRYRRYYGTIMDEGADEEQIRLRLLGRVSSVSTEAMDVCTQIHQEQSSCLVARLREIAKKFARYDYPR